MKSYIKKIIALIITLFIVSVAAFLLFQVVPGDPVSSIVGIDATEEREEQVREELGLNKPVVQRYFEWIGGVVKGDFGRSYKYYKGIDERTPVAELIGDKLPVTLWLALITSILIVVLTVPFGILWARTKNKYVEAAMGVFNQLVMSVPSFFLGILIIYLFGIVMKIFVPGGYVDYREDFMGFLGYMIFPALAIAIPKAAMSARFLRNSMVEEVGKDYVKTAHSKGLPNVIVMYKHILPNALMPVITFFGSIIAEVVAGSVVVEQVFGLPGIGRLLVSSISNRDFPVVQTIILYIATVVVVVYFVVDILYKVIDPRLRKE